MENVTAVVCLNSQKKSSYSLLENVIKTDNDLRHGVRFGIWLLALALFQVLSLL